MRTGWDSLRVVFVNSCSQANKIWGPLCLGESRICEKPLLCHTCILFAGWQKLHIQHALLLLCLTASSLGSCFRSIWTVVKLRFTEFLLRALLIHRMVYSHVPHFSSKSLLQTSEDTGMNEELLFLFSKFMWKQILSYFCGSDCIFKPGAVLCAVLNLVLWKSSRIMGNPCSNCPAEMIRWQVIIWCKKGNEGLFENSVYEMLCHSLGKVRKAAVLPLQELFTFSDRF